MKTKLFVLTFIFFAIFISCNNDDELIQDLDLKTENDVSFEDEIQTEKNDVYEKTINENDLNNDFETVEKQDNFEEAIIPEQEENVDEDISPNCVENSFESQDCENGGKKIRVCKNGKWGNFGDCINIKTVLLDIADNSECSNVYWKDRGHAPKGYTAGVALVFANAVCNQKREDISIVSKAKTTDLKHDALAWYDSIFSSLGMNNNVDGVDVLRHAYTLLLGLGMRESSGKHCCGRDTTATNVTADTAEAGLFQTSYNSHNFGVALDHLFTSWQETSKTNYQKCQYDIFSKNVTCSAKNWQNYGSGNGEKFQELTKKCPAFAVEYTAVMLRLSGGSKGHYGPLRRKEAQVLQKCDAMFKEIQLKMENLPQFCEFL